MPLLVEEGEVGVLEVVGDGFGGVGGVDLEVGVELDGDVGVELEAWIGLVGLVADPLALVLPVRLLGVGVEVGTCVGKGGALVHVEGVVVGGLLLLSLFERTPLPFCLHPSRSFLLLKNRVSHLYVCSL